VSGKSEQGDRTPHGKLEVDRGELTDALSLLTGEAARKLFRHRAVLRFAEGELRIVLGSRSTGASAQGHWPGSASVHPRGLMGLLDVIPDRETVTLVAEGRWVRIGSMSVGAVIVGSDGLQIDIPLNPSSGDLLRLNAGHSPEAVAAAGLQKPVEDAMEEFEVALERVVALVESFGISRDAVENWMESAAGLDDASSGQFGPTQRGLALDVDGEQQILGED
jgi:hypothetical protein